MSTTDKKPTGRRSPRPAKPQQRVPTPTTHGDWHMRDGKPVDLSKPSKAPAKAPTEKPAKPGDKPASKE